MNGLKFRRQYPLGRFVVDFICLKKRLIIELDGGHHQGQVLGDLIRTAWLEKQGFKVIRYWDNEVLNSLGSVTEHIFNELKQPAPHPHLPQSLPPPLRGRMEEGGNMRMSPPSKPSPVKGEGKLLIAVVLACLTSRFAYGDTSGAAFLQIGDGARPLALAGAYTAASGSVDSIYYNPAGLAELDGKELTLTHSAWLEGTTFDVVSYGQSTAVGTLALSALRL